MIKGSKGLRKARSIHEKKAVLSRRTMRGLTGAELTKWLGGAFLLMLIVFYLIANYDYIINGLMCFGETMMGWKTHYHIPMRDGSAYPNCTATIIGGEGVDGDNN